MRAPRTPTDAGSVGNEGRAFIQWPMAAPLMALRDALVNQLSPARKEQVKALAAVIPPQWRQGIAYRQWRRFLGVAQWWPRETIEAWQLDQLQRIVQIAYDHTEGYRALYRRAGVIPRDIRSLDDIRHLPFTTKQMLQENLEAFSVRDFRRRYLTTGGSTGIPFGFYRLPPQDQVEQAFVHAGWSWRGWLPGLRTAVLRGGFVGMAEEPCRYDAFHRSLLCSSYHLTDATLPRYVAAHERYRPQVLQAYPSALNLLCDLLRAAGQVGRMTWDVILLASENVYDWQLEKFEAAFPQARIQAFYGHAECAILAPWCEHVRRYHVWPFYGRTELLDAAGRETAEGDEGELVGTSFHGAATPLIRYRTMDRAVAGPADCAACGRQFRLLDTIAGRAHEFIVTRGGRYISMTAINMHDDSFDRIREFQFFQDQPGAVVFKYAAPRELSADELERVRQRLSAKLGDDVSLRLERVAEIARTAAGKFRFLDQRLALRYGDD